MPDPMPDPYGYELILDLHNCDPAIFTKELVEKFCKDACEVIDMNPEDFHIWASDPDDYETDPPHLHGVSAVQFITTSTLVVHTITKMRRVYINLFSCKSFDPAKASAFSVAYFKGDVVNNRFNVRL